MFPRRAGGAGAFSHVYYSAVVSWDPRSINTRLPAVRHRLQALQLYCSKDPTKISQESASGTRRWLRGEIGMSGGQSWQFLPVHHFYEFLHPAFHIFHSLQFLQQPVSGQGAANLKHIGKKHYKSPDFHLITIKGV